MHHRLGAAVTAAVALIGLAACGSGSGDAEPADADSGFPITVENCGRQVTFDAPPERVMAIGGEAGTLLWAAGATERLSTFSPLAQEPLGDAGADLATRPQLPIQSSDDISREVIIGEQPDLVVAYGVNGTTPEDLEVAGIQTLIVSGYCGGFGAGQSTAEEGTSPLEGVAADVELYGRVLGTSQQADAAAAELRQRVEAVRERAAPDGGSAAALFVGGADTTLGAYGNLSMIHEQMESIGLSNVFAAEPERFFEPNVEALIGGAPEQVIALYEAGDTTEQVVRDEVLGRPEIAQIPAIANQRVLVLDFYYSGHGTLAVDGLEQLAEQLAAQ